jgi:hypothetical protein
MYLTFRLPEKKQYVKRKKRSTSGEWPGDGQFDEETSSL